MRSVSLDLSEKKEDICAEEDSCLRSYYMKAFHTRKRCEISSEEEVDCDWKQKSMQHFGETICAMTTHCER